MTTSWLEVLLVLVTYCGGGHVPSVSNSEVDKCRIERLACIRRAVAQLPSSNADELISMCLTSPSSFPTPKAPEKKK